MTNTVDVLEDLVRPDRSTPLDWNDLATAGLGNAEDAAVSALFTDRDSFLAFLPGGLPALVDDMAAWTWTDDTYAEAVDNYDPRSGPDTEYAQPGETKHAWLTRVTAQPDYFYIDTKQGDEFAYGDGEYGAVHTAADGTVAHVVATPDEHLELVVVRAPDGTVRVYPGMFI